MKQRYQNLSGGSGITSYEVVDDSTLVLEFAGGQFRYVYDAWVPGAEQVRVMIRLARQGRGLATYLNQHVRERYARRLPA